MKPRDKWVDIAKGIAILAVMAHHTSGIETLLFRCFNSFHMPLFFLLSGYYLRPTENLKPASQKDASRILLPYLLTCAMIILTGIPADLTKNVQFGHSLSRWLIASLYGVGNPFRLNGFTANFTPIGAIWFLLALFIARFVVRVSFSAGRAKWFFISAISYVGWLFADKVWLPFSVLPGFCASAYVCLGVECRELDFFVCSDKAEYRLPRLFVFFIWLVYFLYFNNIDCASCTYPNGLFDLVGSISGCFCVLWASRWLERKSRYVSKVLAWVGEKTLPILCMHIIEMHFFPWDKLLYAYPIGQYWLVRLLARLLLVAILCTILYFIPKLNEVYYGKKKPVPAA